MDYVLQIFYILVYFFCPRGLSYEGGMLDSAITKVFIYFPAHPVVFFFFYVSGCCSIHINYS